MMRVFAASALWALIYAGPGIIAVFAVIGAITVATQLLELLC
jgi:hypothetical protein